MQHLTQHPMKIVSLFIQMTDSWKIGASNGNVSHSKEDDYVLKTSDVAQISTDFQGKSTSVDELISDA